MFRIINKQILASGVKRLDVEAPNIAQRALPGQFVSVCPQEGEERIPLSIIETDQKKNTIALIFHEIGETTQKLGSLSIGDNVFSILGPLGEPIQIKKIKEVVCIATGVGAAQILPVCRAFKQAGTKVIGIIGAKKKTDLLLEAQMRLSCNKLHIATEDGSYERRGLATDVLDEILAKRNVDLVYAIGSVDMMESVCNLTKPKRIKTRVYLNTIMLDCMGMCGACRIRVSGKEILACLEGPEFDGHKVDFSDLAIRMNAFKRTEQWDNQTTQHNPARDESGILTKFLSGLIKK